MPYIVKRGEIWRGAQHYGVGQVLPEGVADEAMVDAGAVEWREPAVADAPSEDLEPSAPADSETTPEEDTEAAPAHSEPDLDVLDIYALRDAAKAAGISFSGKSAKVLRDELRAVT